MDKKKTPFLQSISTSLQNNISVTTLAIITVVVALVSGTDLLSILLLAAIWYCWFSREVIRNDAMTHKRISKWLLSPVVLFLMAYLIYSFNMIDRFYAIRSRALLVIVIFARAIPWISIAYMFVVIFQNDRPRNRSQKNMINIKTLVTINAVSLVFVLDKLALFSHVHKGAGSLYYDSAFLLGSWHGVIYHSVLDGYKIVSFLMMVLYAVQLIAITIFTVKVALSLNAVWKENKQYCPYCGASIPGDKKFCVKCGNKVQ